MLARARAKSAGPARGPVEGCACRGEDPRHHRPHPQARERADPLPGEHGPRQQAEHRHQEEEEG